MMRIVETNASGIQPFELVLTNADAKNTGPMNDRAGSALEHIEKQTQRLAIWDSQRQPHPGVRRKIYRSQ